MCGRQNLEQLADDVDGDLVRHLVREALPDLLDARAFEELHDEEGDAVLGDVVVRHEHRAGVLHGVGRVALAQEARANRRVAAQVREQHLDRELGAVAVRGAVHDGHSPDADERIEPVLAVQRRAETLPCDSLDVAFGHLVPLSVRLGGAMRKVALAGRERPPHERLGDVQAVLSRAAHVVDRGDVSLDRGVGPRPIDRVQHLAL